MNTKQNTRYRRLLNELGITEDAKRAMLASFTAGRSTSSKDLTDVETEAMLRYLQDEHSLRCKPMRGKIIHYLCLLGYVVGNNQPDWNRINDFIKAIGSNNPRQVQLNFLYYSELPKVVSQVEAMYKHELKRLAK
jgi:hypothetical protein